MDAFVRLSGDSPLLDQRLVERATAIFADSEADLVTNVFPRTFPRGQSVEVVRTTSFLRACELMRDPDDYEHVTRVFYQDGAPFHVLNFESSLDCGDAHFAVDTAQDFAAVEAILQAMTRPHWDYPLDKMLAIHHSLLRRT
jgi:spore coat polysaccharide biosynthesis protein SpsF (cytidylyltransferase family)